MIERPLLPPTAGVEMLAGLRPVSHPLPPLQPPPAPDRFHLFLHSASFREGHGVFANNDFPPLSRDHAATVTVAITPRLGRSAQRQ